MDNIFLDEGIEMNENNYVNENNIIDRDLNLVKCENNERNLYDIDKLIVKDVYRENILLSKKDTNHTSHDSKTLRFNLNNDKAGGIQYKKNVIGFRLNECIYTSPIFNITDNNKTIEFSIDGNTTKTITIEKGFYTIFTLLGAINSSTLNDGVTIVNTKFTLTFDITLSNVTLNLTSGTE